MRVIWGIAESLGPISESDRESGRIRIYSDRSGREYVGTETTDVDYYCSEVCLRDNFYSRGYPLDVESAVIGPVGDPTAPTGERDKGRVVTIDVGPVQGDWPSYSVSCVSCGDMVNEVEEESE